MNVRVGDLFVAGEEFTLTPGAWVVMGVDTYSDGHQLLMMRPDGVLQWTGKYAWMCWEHFPAEVQDADQSR